MKTLILLLFTVSMNTSFAETKTYKISCEKLIQFIHEINRTMPDDQKFNLACEETYKSQLGGHIKYKFRATAKLSSSVKLCPNAEFSHQWRYSVDIQNYLGFSLHDLMTIEEFMEDHSITMHLKKYYIDKSNLSCLDSIQLPICE